MGLIGCTFALSMGALTFNASSRVELGKEHPESGVQAQPTDLEATSDDDLDAIVLRLMQAPGGRDYEAALNAAFDEFQRLAAVHDYDRALRVMKDIYDDTVARGEPYFRTQNWAGGALALAYTRADRHDDAERIASERIQVTRDYLVQLRRQLEAARASGSDSEVQSIGYVRDLVWRQLTDLYDRRALGRIGAGRTDLARRDLGAALARGSSDAGVVLGRIALTEGRLEDARAIFRELLAEEPPQAWALRGWGLTMLP